MSWLSVLRECLADPEEFRRTTVAVTTGANEQHILTIIFPPGSRDEVMVMDRDSRVVSFAKELNGSEKPDHTHPLLNGPQTHLTSQPVLF